MNKYIINNVLYEVVKPTDMRMIKVKSLSGEFVVGYLTSFYYD